MRTCHYVILDIDKNASETDIKKAYRRRALEWHPDKNSHRIEEATKQFALIAEAYEVLSDPQERAWYDSHRDAILRGDDKSDQAEGAAGTTTADLMKYFSASIYKGFQDNNASFFTVYRNLFEKLAQEESEAVANDRSSSDNSGSSKVHYPSFGCSTTPYDSSVTSETTTPTSKARSNNKDDVIHFYNAFLTFSTQKSFSWCDKFRLSEAPDRRVRRAMEKENKKFRDAARKEFNDTVLVSVAVIAVAVIAVAVIAVAVVAVAVIVGDGGGGGGGRRRRQSLAQYVRKRDPRFIAYQEHLQRKQKAMQAEIKARAEKAKEELRAKVEQYQEQAWSRIDGDNDDDDGEKSGSDQDEHNDDYDQEFECIVCDKFFKSERQWKNHERSKRHLKAVEDIRLEMLHEENELMKKSGSHNEENDSDGDNNAFDDDDVEVEEIEMPGSKPRSNSSPLGDTLSGSDLDDDDDAPTPVYSTLKSKKKNKKKKVMTVDHAFDEAELDDMNQDDLVDLLGSARLSSSTSNLGSRAGTPNNRQRGSRTARRGLGDSDMDEPEGDTPVSTAPVSRAESPDGLAGSKTKKLSGKAKKKARSEAAAQKLAESGATTRCRICNEDFDSKNRLFEHIKETGHAIAVPATGTSSPAASAQRDDAGWSSEEERGRGKGKKGRGKRK
ncbi:hypothetical protein BGZ94_003894 [Podila epigama]|nr:hypothetical protein BGZ94_003894 [Podila epigama]